MPDWTRSMQQTFEYFEVNPTSWRDSKKLYDFTSSTVNRDNTNETKGTASLDSTESFGEIYVRIYLKTIQDEFEESHPLGTYIIQTPHDNYDGRKHSFSYDAYSPLLELKDNKPPLGYYIPKGSNVMAMVNQLCFDYCRAPVVYATSDVTLVEDFVADSDDTWLSFLTDLAAKARFSIGLDELSQIIFIPDADSASLQPIWEYNDDNSSILYPDISQERDLYGIPNVVQVVYTDPNSVSRNVEIVNDDPSSPTSTVRRGRVVLHRETSPSFNGLPSEEEITAYARTLLRELSTLEYKVTYKHGYCPVRPGDGVLLTYEKAGIFRQKAKVVSQSISCVPGCPVEETAIFTVKMWEG